MSKGTKWFGNGGPIESMHLKLVAYVPSGPVGVPEIVAVEGSKDSPVGNGPPPIDHEIVPYIVPVADKE
jgi:hypothetical protein